MIKKAKIIKKRRFVLAFVSPKVVSILFESPSIPRFHFKDVELVLINFTIKSNMSRASTEVAK